MPEKVIIVYKDGSHKVAPKQSAWEYENDPEYLVTVEPETFDEEEPK